MTVQIAAEDIRGLLSNSNIGKSRLGTINVRYGVIRYRSLVAEPDAKSAVARKLT